MVVTRLLSALGCVLALGLTVSMVLLGWPEQTTTQRVLLALSSLPLQLLAVLALLRLGLGGRWATGLRITRTVAGACWILGVVLVLLSQLVGQSGPAGPWLALSWLAVLALLVSTLMALPRRPGRLARFIRTGEEDPAALWQAEVSEADESSL